eukprot:gene29121-45206_t
MAAWPVRGAGRGRGDAVITTARQRAALRDRWNSHVHAAARDATAAGAAAPLPVAAIDVGGEQHHRSVADGATAADGTAGGPTTPRRAAAGEGWTVNACVDVLRVVGICGAPLRDDVQRELAAAWGDVSRLRDRVAVFERGGVNGEYGDEYGKALRREAGELRRIVPAAVAPCGGGGGWSEAEDETAADPRRQLAARGAALAAARRELAAARGTKRVWNEAACRRIEAHLDRLHLDADTRIDEKRGLFKRGSTGIYKRTTG